MKIKTILAFAVIFTLLAASPALAAPATLSCDTEKPGMADKHRENYDAFMKDPVKYLEGKKSDILKLENEGKITKEKAEQMVKKIDSAIAEIKAFNKLTLQQKKDKLINACRSRLDVLVRDGKIDRKKADEIFKNYSEKIKQWDGTGFPKYFDKSIKGGKH